MMTRPNQLTGSPEIDNPEIESFMALENMRGMVQASLQRAGRIDNTGVVQPIEVKRRLHDEERWALGPSIESEWRHDIFVPTQEDLKTYYATDQLGHTTRNHVRNPFLASNLYDYLTQSVQGVLIPEQVDDLITQRQQLEATLSAATDYTWRLDTSQLQDTYHVHARHKPTPDFDEIRVYVPGGLQAPNIATSVFEAGASMNYAKIWTTSPTTDMQPARNDTPIFGIQTYAQARSVFGVLRQLAARGELRKGRIPLAGHKVEDLPGVYIGQGGRHQSFNGMLQDLFGGPIQQAASEVKLHAGDTVSEDIMTDIAFRARELAHARAVRYGRDPSDHAFLANQPVDAILRTIEQA